MKRLLVILLSTVGLIACAPGVQELVDSFNPQGIGLGDEATVQRGPLAGQIVTVTGYEGGPKVQTTAGDIPIAHLSVEQNSLYFCVGQWVWDDSIPDFAYWRPPHPEIIEGSFDLRNVTRAGKHGGVPEGYGIFVYDVNPNDPTLICKTDAAEKGRAITGDAEKSLISLRLGTSEPVEPVTICGVLLEYATGKHASDIGVSPLEPSPDGSYKLLFGKLTCDGVHPFD